MPRHKCTRSTRTDESMRENFRRDQTTQENVFLSSTSTRTNRRVHLYVAMHLLCRTTEEYMVSTVMIIRIQKDICQHYVCDIAILSDEFISKMV